MLLNFKILSTTIFLFFCLALNAQQKTYPREDLNTFFEIFMEAKSVTTYATEQDAEIIRRQLKLSQDELKIIVANQQTTRDQVEPSYDHPFFHEINKLVSSKKLQKEAKIKSLCTEKKFSHDLYNEILKKYNESTEFQNIVCQNVQ